MTTLTYDDKPLAERTEILYSNTNITDNESFHKNFTTIQHVLRQCNDEEQLSTVCYFL